MASNELAVRFTEEKYCTKNEVIKELKMSLIDNIWSNILSYRSEFNKYLLLRSVERNQYSFCRCYNVQNIIEHMHISEDKYASEFDNIDKGDRKLFFNNQLLEILTQVASLNKIDAAKSMINALIKEQNITISDNSLILSNYLKAIKYCSLNYNNVNLNYIFDVYKILIGSHLADYRGDDAGDKDNKYLYDRTYSSSPAKLIPSMMSYLEDFIVSSPDDKFFVAAAVLYYIDYVKPFAKYNKELAVLISKSILAREIGEIALYIPLEKIYLEEFALNKVINDTQKSSDLTYYAIYAIEFLQKEYALSLDNVIQVKSQALKTDFYKIDQEEKSEENVEPVVIKEERTVEEKPVKVKKEETFEQITIDFNQEKAPSVEKKEITAPNKNKSIPVRKAFEFNEPKIDERELKKMATHLMELDPLLSKKEAKFYAGHCTIGKMYSIGQFKKEIGCVYETARTSMEHLAVLGYYRKEQVKNKFFYTPVIRK